MRSRQFNVSPDVYEAYWAIARMEAGEAGLCHSTPDEIVDAVLRNYVEQKYPTLLAKLAVKRKLVDELDKELIEQLTKPT